VFGWSLKRSNEWLLAHDSAAVLHADVTVNRTTSQVTAALTNTGKVGACFAVYPDNYLTSGGTPFTVLPSAQRAYVWGREADRRKVRLLGLRS